jgi:hypothetical protein
MRAMKTEKRLQRLSRLLAIFSISASERSIGDGDRGEAVERFI